jgi:glucose/arabinose dehydrogenase
MKQSFFFGLILMALASPAFSVPIKLKKVCTVTELPTHIEAVPFDSDSVFITSKEGQLSQCFLKTGLVKKIHKFEVISPSEMGLLSLVFSPQFLKNGLFYIHRNVQKSVANITEVSEWKFSNQESLSSPHQERVIFETTQPYNNHNGGTLIFDKNEKLLLGLGDGGAAGDPHNHSQNPNSYLGKILEFDLLLKPKPQPQIYALGLRNPWKMSWSLEQKLIVADVGQNKFEEINLVEKGKNYGWKVMEGKHCFSPKKNCISNNFEPPIFEYDHSWGQSVTGGFVATSSRYSKLKNQYVFGDFETGRIWALRLDGDKSVQEIAKVDFSISTFGITKDGQILVANFYSGDIFLIEE